MLYIFSGSDDYSKKLHVGRIVQGLGLPVADFPEGSAPDAYSLVGGDLFGGSKIFILHNQASGMLDQGILEAFKKSQNHIFFLEDSIDKRTTFAKKLLQDKGLSFQDFPAPEGKGLVTWVEGRVRELGGSINHGTAARLLERMGVTLAEMGSFGAGNKVSLWQIDSELNKLVTYADGASVSDESIELLVPENFETQGFDIINALAEKNRTKVFSLCERFFAEAGGSDEKAKFILLGSLLADQFRSILIVQGSQAAGVPESEVLAKTGWKPGRLFMVKKVAGRFEQKKVTETLGRLESFDSELKTTNTPPHVLIDLILAQVV